MSDRRLPWYDRLLDRVGLARRSSIEVRHRIDDPVISRIFEAAGDPGARIALPAVEASIGLIAGTVASLPARVLRLREAEGGAFSTYEADYRHPASRVLAYPCPDWTAYELVERVTADTALSGNGYAEIVRDGRGAPAALHYLPPGNVSVERSPATGRPIYRVNDPRDNAHRVLSDEDVLHVRYRIDPADPLRGMALPRIGAGTLDLAVATERHARNLFEKGARPGGFVKTGKQLKPETRTRLRGQIEHLFGGVNSGSVAVLEEGMDWQELSANNRDSQLVETSELLVSAVARLFGVPPPLIGQLANTNYSSLQALVSVWTRTGLRSWLSRIEAALTDKLLSEDAKASGLQIRFDVSELVRLDEKERSEVYARSIAAGWLAPNEARARENMPPLPGGEVLQRMPGAGIASEPGRPEGARSIESDNPTKGPNADG